MERLKTISAVALATALGLGAAGIAQAQMARGGDHQPMTFEELDANGDGSISPDEIQALAASRFAERDTSGDGVLDADELLAAMTASAMERAKTQIDRMITWADKDGDGALSADELPGRDRTMMLSHLDQDGDGLISAEEFEAAKDRRGGKRSGRDGRGEHGGRAMKGDHGRDGHGPRMGGGRHGG